MLDWCVANNNVNNCNFCILANLPEGNLVLMFWLKLAFDGRAKVPSYRYWENLKEFCA